MAATAQPSASAPLEPSRSDPGVAQFALPQMLSPNDVHVLLVDDERVSRMVVGNVLRKCNYKVTIADSGGQAVSMLRSHPLGTFQLVLTDVMMPDVDGIELLRFLRGNDAFAAVPVVMMSANEQNDTVFECIRGGAEDYLLKPVTRKEVQNIWQHVWRRQQQLLVPILQEEHDDALQTSRPASVPVVSRGGAIDTSAAASTVEPAERSNSTPFPPSARDQAGELKEPAQNSRHLFQGQELHKHDHARAQQKQLSRPVQLPKQRLQASSVVHGQSVTSRHAALQQPAVAANSSSGAITASEFQQAANVAEAIRQPTQSRVRSQTLQNLQHRRSHGPNLSPSELPPSRPMAEFLATSAGLEGEDSFRVLCQVLGYLRAAHAAGKALGRLRPSALRVTASRIVVLDSRVAIPAAEEALYAAPEELVPTLGPTAGSSQPASRPKRSMPADMFSFGLLLLQLLHPVPDDTTRYTADEASGHHSVPAQVSPALQQLLSDARHQILPNAMLQGRPTEAALLTSLLSTDPASRPVVDDVLRCGLLRQLHSSITTSQACHGPPTSSSAPHSQPTSVPVEPVQAQAPSKALHPRVAAPEARSVPAPAAAQPPPAAVKVPRPIRLGLSDSVALQDFLRLAQESVLREAAAVSDQIKALTTDAATVMSCMTAVTAAAARSTGAQQSQNAAEHAKSRKRCRSDLMEDSPHLSTAADSTPSPVPESTLRLQPDNASDGHTNSRNICLPSSSISSKFQRISTALPAVDAAFFRGRADADSAGRLMSPTMPLVPALPQQSQLASPHSTSAQPIDMTSPQDDAVFRASQLPGHLAMLGRDLEAFCRYSKFRVVTNLKYGDGFAAPDMICSTAFDRDDQFFATAGASRHVKVYEYASLLEDVAAGGRSTHGTHYPVLDLPFRARLSCITWNTYLKSHLLAADYDGITTLVDASSGCEVASYAEHAKRVWSIDFSATDPQRFLSGSDDGTVRLWSINEQSAVAAINAKANVCSVQFSPTDANIMAFGAANYRTYLYDLRHVRSPLATIQGHSRAVSYVRFLASGKRLLTASTDNALKMWDIATLINCQPGQLAVADMTYTGHMNEKNFVGLSVTDEGYIATGSEDNSVVAYHASMPLPVARHSFASTSGTANACGVPSRRCQQPDAAHFVGSVAWARHGSTCVASNSQGHLRVLQLTQ